MINMPNDKELEERTQRIYGHVWDDMTPKGKADLLIRHEHVVRGLNSAASIFMGMVIDFEFWKRSSSTAGIGLLLKGIAADIEGAIEEIKRSIS